jgi:uncharacterized protein YcbK (DUF882 family)
MSKYIEGTHITWDEYKCRHCGALPPDFYKDGEISVEYYMIFQAFELIRGAWGEPITVNSGYRCLTHQLNLFRQRRSPTPLSVHLFGLALDLKCKDAEEVESMYKVAKAVPSKLRIGWQEYIDKPKPWIHIDLGHMIVPRYSEKLRPGAEW